DRAQRVVLDLQLDVVELEELAVLLHDRVARTREDLDQRFLVQVVDVRDDREPSDELGDESVLEKVFGHHLSEDLTEVLLFELADVGAEADALATDASLDDLLETRERTAADEQDVRGLDLDEFLVRMLASALRGNRSDRSLENLQQRLLHALAGHVARDRGVLGLARDLVDLVDVNDSGLGALHVVVGG